VITISQPTSTRANTDRVQFRDRRDRTTRIALGRTGRAYDCEEIIKKTRAHTRLALMAYLYMIIPPPKHDVDSGGNDIIIFV